MASYYEILGVKENASSTEVRAAYKRMAMLYHPDRNPGNLEAEELFKSVNEAYHVLSDPLKRSRYDARFSYQSVESSHAYWAEVQRRRYQRWQHVDRSRYRFDKQYFKIQGLAFLVFLILAGFCFGVIHIINWVTAMNYEAQYRENSRKIKQVEILFSRGDVDQAFDRIQVLRNNDPLEYRFLFTHDSLVNVLRRNGDKSYYQGNYDQASYFYQYLKKYEFPQRPETLQRAAVSEYHVGNYDESLQTLKRLLNQQPWNLDLVYQIGIINLENLKNMDEALHYFTLGKKLFRENLTKVYGEAFEVVMNPADVPDIYFEIFEGRARTNINLGAYSEAVKDCNWAIYLRPSRPLPHKLRAIARAGTADHHGICDDLYDARRLGATGLDELTARFCR